VEKTVLNHDESVSAGAKTDNHELVFALVAPAETNLDWVSAELANHLRDEDYEVLTIRLSQFLPAMNITSEQGERVSPKKEPRDDYLESYMDAGTELRHMVDRALTERARAGKEPFDHEPGGALAYLAAEFIARVRERTDFDEIAGKSLQEILGHIDAHPDARQPVAKKGIPRRAYILRSLKHPQEVYVLRKIYDSGAYVIGVHSHRALRKKKLADEIAAPFGHNENTPEYKEHAARAEGLLLKDEAEPDKLGQRVRDTFHLADLFIDLADESETSLKTAASEIERFVELIMGNCLHTPTIDEHLMFVAHAVALRSASLGRQVGAVIGSADGELISTGSNDVPRAGGGQYWPNEHYDHRDVKQDEDASNVQRRKIIQEIIEVIVGEQNAAAIDADAILDQLDKKRFASVIEFSRTVHAEMEAILSAARRGSPIAGTHLYTTTFPCHECARLIVGAGIRRVVYIEPYPKSLAGELFEHEIALDDDPATEQCSDCGRPHKIRFAPFSGVGPHRYMELFGLATSEGRRRERKSRKGKLIAGSQQKPIRPLSPLSYLEKEARAGVEIQELLASPIAPVTPSRTNPDGSEPVVAEPIEPEPGSNTTSR
jgi:cytidine deaminase